MSADRQSIYSFTSLLRQLRARQGQLTGEANVEAASDFLKSRRGKLKACANPFGSPNAASRSKVESGNVEDEDGKAIQLKQEDRDLAKSIAERLVLDEVEAARLLLLWKRHHAGSSNGEAVEANDDFWTGFTAFHFDERLDIINTVGYLLRIVPQETEDLDATPVNDTAGTFLKSLLDPLQTSECSRSLLQRAVHLARTPVPASAGADTLLWAKQHVREQKALLEVYFLLFYNRMYPNGHSLLDILDAIAQSEWGTLQVNEGYFDAEAHALASAVPNLLTLLALENLNLDRAHSKEVDEYNVPPSPERASEQYLLLHPVTFLRIHNEIMTLAHETRFPLQSGPLLLGWAFILHRVIASIQTETLPAEYFDVADVLLPLHQHPKRAANSASIPQANKSAEPLSESLLAYAISAPSVQALQGLYAVLSSSPIGAADAASDTGSPDLEDNLVGYLAVVQSVLGTFTSIIHLPALSVTEFQDLCGVFEKLYAHPAAGPLRASFWDLLGNPLALVPQGHLAILELAQERFPCDCISMLRLLRALSPIHPIAQGSADIDASYVANDLDAFCSAHLQHYLQALPSATQLEPPISPIVPLPYEVSSAIESDSLDVVSTRPVIISASVSVEAGTYGRIVSPEDRRPAVIRWDLSETPYNAWLLIGDVLADFVGSPTAHEVPPRTPGDVFGQHRMEEGPVVSFQWESAEEQIQAVGIALDIIHAALSHPVSQAATLVEYLGHGRAELFFATLFKIFDIAFDMPSSSRFLLPSCIRAVTSLIHHFPGITWTYLKAAPFLFPLSSSVKTQWRGYRDAPSYVSVLSVDKAKGEYSATLAQLDLLSAMADEAQHSILATSSSGLADLRGDVLARATKWSIDYVWSSLSTWRYRDVKQKYGIIRRCSTFFSSILAEVDYTIAERPKALSSAVETLIGSLLADSTTSHIALFLESIVHSSSDIPRYHRNGRAREALEAEQALCASLQLLHRILSMSRAVMPQQPSLLERTLFAAASSSGQADSGSTDAICNIFTYLTSSEYSVRTASCSARVLARLACLSRDWGIGPARPSFLGHLGGIKDSLAILRITMDIAGDPFVDLELQIDAWNLLRVIVQNQPGLSELLLTGSQAFAPLLEDGSVTVKQTSETAVSLALKCLEGWEEAWERQPALLAQALECLVSVWEDSADHGKYETQYREDRKIWSSVQGILSKAVGEAPSTRDLGNPASTLGQTQLWCYRISAQSAAARLLALDVRQSISNTETKKPVNSESFRTLAGILGQEHTLSAALTAATASSFDPDFHEQSDRGLSDSLGLASLEAYRHPSYHFNVAKDYGPDFLFPLDILKKRIQGCDHPDLDHSARVNALVRIEALNLAWSIYDAQASLLAAWQNLLELSLPEVPLSKPVLQSIRKASLALVQLAAEESRDGGIVEQIHTERLALLKIMLLYIGQPTMADASDVGNLIAWTRKLLTNENLDPVESLRQEKGTFHRAVFEVSFLAFGKAVVPFDQSVAASNAGQSSLALDTEISLAVALSALQAILAVITRETPSKDSIQDVTTVTSLIQQILGTPLQPRASIWLAYCQELDLFRSTFYLLSSISFTGPYESISLHLLHLCLTVAKFPQGAEKMAIEGLVATLNNNALTADLESGRIQPRNLEDHTDGNNAHRHWCLMMSIMTQLVSQLGASIPFMENDVLAFLHLYSKQLELAFLYTPADSLGTGETRAGREALTLDALREMRVASLLLVQVVAHSNAVASIQPLLYKLVQRSLLLLQQLVYLLQHPTSLSKLIEPTTAEEQSWLQAEIDATETITLATFDKRPVAASIIQEVFTICQTLVSAATIYTNAFVIIGKDEVDWPANRNVISATVSTSLGETASQGTLIDLARSCIEASSTKTASQTDTKGPLPAFEASRFSAAMKYAIEGCLLLMGTQLALVAKQQDLTLGQDRASQRARNDLHELATDFRDEFLERGGTQPAVSQPDPKLIAALKSLLLRCKA